MNAMPNTRFEDRETEPGTQIASPDQFAWRKYRKRPVVISATRMNVPFKVETLEGWMEGQPGDWLVEGIERELYPCKDSVFQVTYEVVE